jgi:hypothetical protein
MLMQDLQNQPRLSNDEWRAIAIALKDAEHSVDVAPRDKPEGRLGRIFRMLTGIEKARPLADPRLDTIRRFAWATRRRIARAREIGGELRAFGYSCEQIEALRLIAA